MPAVVVNKGVAVLRPVSAWAEELAGWPEYQAAAVVVVLEEEEEEEQEEEEEAAVWFGTKLNMSLINIKTKSEIYAELKSISPPEVVMDYM